MRKMVYYLGAGASYNSMPVLQELILRIQSQIEQLKTFDGVVDDYERDFEFIYDDMPGHPTIDTLAKRYYLLKDDKRFKSVKRLLVTFFSIEGFLNFPSRHVDYEPNQSLHVPSTKSRYRHLEYMDARYVGLLAAVLKRPEDVSTSASSNSVSFVSWNYDHQLLQAFAMFGVMPDHVVYPALKGESPAKVYCLNGVAGIKFYPDDHIVFAAQPLFDNERVSYAQLATTDLVGRSELNAERVKKILDIIYNEDRVINSIEFAWEKQTPNKMAGKDLLSSAQTSLRESSDVIVIGYSFPAFNREVDRFLLHNAGIERLWIQNKVEPDRSMLEELTGCSDIRWIEQVDYFHTL